MTNFSEKTLAVIKGVHFGVGDRGRVALWFSTYVTETGAALQYFDRPDDFIKIISDYGVQNVFNLEGKPCWVDTSNRGLIRWVGAWKA